MKYSKSEEDRQMERKCYDKIYLKALFDGEEHLELPEEPAGDLIVVEYEHDTEKDTVDIIMTMFNHNQQIATVTFPYGVSTYNVDYPPEFAQLHGFIEWWVGDNNIRAMKEGMTYEKRQEEERRAYLG